MTTLPEDRTKTYTNYFRLLYDKYLGRNRAVSTNPSTGRRLEKSASFMPSKVTSSESENCQQLIGVSPPPSNSQDSLQKICRSRTVEDALYCPLERHYWSHNNCLRHPPQTAALIEAFSGGHPGFYQPNSLSIAYRSSSIPEEEDGYLDSHGENCHLHQDPAATEGTMNSATNHHRRFFRMSSELSAGRDVEGFDSDQQLGHGSDFSEDLDSLSDLDLLKGSPQLQRSLQSRLKSFWQNRRFSSRESLSLPNSPNTIQRAKSMTSRGATNQLRHMKMSGYNSTSGRIEADPNGPGGNQKGSSGPGSSGLNLGGLRRGGHLRTSMPSVLRQRQTVSGNILLIYRDEVKRLELPDKVIHVETIKRLFISAFPKKLSLDHFEGSGKAIYVLDKKTNLFYELENLRDVQDSSVLKIHETPATPNSSEPCSITPDFDCASHYPNPHSPPPPPAPPSTAVVSQLEYLRREERNQYFSDSELDSVRFPGKMTSRNQSTKTATKQQQVPRPQPASQTGSPQQQHRCRSLGRPRGGDPFPNPPQQGAIVPGPCVLASLGNQNSASHNSNHLHGEHLVCTCPPELHQALFEQQQKAASLQTEHPDTAPTIPELPNLNAATLPLFCKLPEDGMEAQQRIVYMEAQLSHLTSWIQALQSHSRDGTLPLILSKVPQQSSHTPSNSSLDSAYSARSTTSSDISGHSTHTLPVRASPSMIQALHAAHYKIQSLKSEVVTLRRAQQSTCATLKDEMNDMFHTIKKLITKIPGADEVPVRAERCRLDSLFTNYRTESELAERRLCDLEMAIEDLRVDVLQRKCRVRVPEVEALALHLSSVSKTLADFKSQFPAIQHQVKSVIQPEMEIVVRDEKFLKLEPTRLDASLKRCKKLTGTLFTLKRLGSVQEHSEVDNIPNISTLRVPDVQDRKVVLESIQSLVPDHDKRVKNIKISEDLRDLKRRMLTSQESLKFEKSLQLAAKNLRAPNGPATDVAPRASSESDGTSSDSPSSAGGPLDNDKINPLMESSLNDAQDSGNESASGHLGKGELPASAASRISDHGSYNGVSKLDSPLEQMTSFCNSATFAGSRDSSPNLAETSLPPISVLSSVPVHYSAAVMSSGSLPGTILKQKSSMSSSQAPNLPPKYGRVNKVVFSETVLVEDGSEQLRLNCLGDEDAEPGDTLRNNKVPPPPPPRKSSRISIHDYPNNARSDYENLDHFPENNLQSNGGMILPPPPPAQDHNHSNGNLPQRGPQAGHPNNSNPQGVQRWVDTTNRANPAPPPTSTVAVVDSSTLVCQSKSPILTDETDVWQRQNPQNTITRTGGKLLGNNTIQGYHSSDSHSRGKTDKSKKK